MGNNDSTYYPPRARWYSPLLSLGDTFRHRLALDRLHLPPGASLLGTAASIFIPGLGFYVRGPRLYGLIAVGASALMLIAFFVWLGYTAANWLSGLLLAVHTSGLVYLFGPLLSGLRFRFRLLTTFIVLVLLLCFLYLPAQNFLENRVLMPLLARGNVVIVRRAGALQSVRRGEIIAYSFDSRMPLPDRGFYFGEGYGIGPVLAFGGETVRFKETTFTVNGVSSQRLYRMPTDGEFVVPEKSCFVWPDINVMVRGGVPEGTVAGNILRMATVSEAQYVGTPFKRWFWRRQISP